MAADLLCGLTEYLAVHKQAGASPGQTKWGGQYGWGVERGVPSQVEGLGLGIQSKAYQYAAQRLNPRNTLGKKVGVSTPVHPVATPLQAGKHYRYGNSRNRVI